MNNQFNHVQWVVQKGLTNVNDMAALKAACGCINVDLIEIDIIPFTESLPDFNKNKESIFYGSTTLCALVYKAEELRKGLFYDEKEFSIENYLGHWGKHMLNSDAVVTTIAELARGDYHPDKLLFVRPDADSKLFAGEVISFKDVREWCGKLNATFDKDMREAKIIVAEPYNIQYEWRLWIVEKRVVAASKYREYFRLAKEKGCPAEVIKFAEQRCTEYTPATVFVMDVCLCGDEYFIVECGCMNGAGFYAANIGDIVSAVTEYFARICAA
jgi:hypothetical protein